MFKIDFFIVNKKQKAYIINQKKNKFNKSIFFQLMYIKVYKLEDHLRKYTLLESSIIIIISMLVIIVMI